MLKLENGRDRAQIRHLATGLVRRTSRPLAVVVGSSVNALGVVRSLGQAFVPVLWLASEPRSYVHASRWSALGVACGDLYEDGLVPTLLDLGELLDQRPVLFLTHDFQVQRVSDARDVLGGRYRFALPPRHITDALLGKAAFYALARRLDLAIADTWIVADSPELAAFLAADPREGPWVVKPVHKSDAFEQHFGKALRIAGQDEWHAFALRYASVNEPLMIQPWLEGPDSSVYFCLVAYDEGGTLLSSFSGRKIRQFKPEVGNTASAERHFDPVVHERTLQFFRQCEFVGMGSLEFKRDRRTGELLAIEPTIGRTDLQSEMSTVNDCNLAVMYYCALTGRREDLEAHRARAARSTASRVWRRGGADWRSAAFYRRRGQLTTRDWLRSLLRPTAFSVWRWSDPGPFARFVAQRVQGHLVRGLKAALRRAGVSRPAPRSPRTDT